MYSWKAGVCQGHLALMKKSETAELHLEASVWLPEERLLVLLSNCAIVRFLQYLDMKLSLNQ